jgi:hypothetical protein
MVHPWPRFVDWCPIEKVMDSVVYSKKCLICMKKPNKIKQHVCVKNYEGSSKPVEASALTKMLIRIPEEMGVTICTIITDDDSNGQSKLCHVDNGDILSTNVKEPAFHADPSHQKRVVARAIYNLSNLPMNKNTYKRVSGTYQVLLWSVCEKK